MSISCTISETLSLICQNLMRSRESEHMPFGSNRHTVLCICVRQARRSAESSAAGVRTDDISATRRLRIRVLQALLDALPQPPAVQAVVVSDFEAALWSAVRFVFPGVAQCGCEFHFSQAVWRNVQSVGLQSAYAKDDVINRPRLPQDTGAMFPAGRCHWR